MREPADHKARERICTSFQETIFVEAGAGTGKTTALVARVVHMVATGHLKEIGELAAITFTENAAAELRNGIREALDVASRPKGCEHLEDGERLYDEQQRELCLIALRSLDDAVITTLHGFSARILGEAPIEAGLPPGFGVADTMASSVCSSDAWRDFVDVLLEDKVVRPQLLAGLTIDPSILSTMHAIASTMSGSWDRLLDHPLTVRPLPPIHGRAVVAALREAVKDRAKWPVDDKLTAFLQGPATATLDALVAATDPMDVLEILTQKLSAKCGQAPAWAKMNLNKAEVVDALLDAENARTKLVDDVGAAVTETLAALVQDWVLTQAQRRRRDGSLDYHDLLVLARDLLRDNSSVRRRLHQTWPVLMVDEFQDTDPLQVQIVHLLAGSPDGSAPGQEPRGWADIQVEGGRLFFVGDPKQSIFRFRRADIETFREVGRRHGGGSTALTVNFRSVPGVIAATNAVFQELIGDDATSGIAYIPLQEYRTAMSAGNGCTPDLFVPAPVQLLGGPQDADMATLRTRESEHIADLIVRAKKQGWLVDHKKPHKASYGDVAILLPTRASLGSLERALLERDVPYRVESRSLVWATDAVRDLITMLQAVDNPSDEVAVLAALRHPGLACTDEALVQWRATGGRWNYMATATTTLPSDHPVAAGLSELRRWHEARWWIPVNELVASLVRDLRLIELTATAKRPRDHWRRLRFVVDQSRAWCDAGGSGLGSFVEWAAQQIEDEADVLETVVPEADDDAVRILTVHGAKGQQFPITIVTGLASTGGRNSNLVWDDEGRPQIRLKAGSLETRGYTAWKQSNDRESALEATRLLYVALTRAKEYLVLGCYHKPPVTGQKSHAQKVWDLLSTTDLATVDLLPTRSPNIAHTPAATDGDVVPSSSPCGRDEFASTRDQLLVAVSARVATSPTALVKEAQAKEVLAKVAPANKAAMKEASRRADAEGTDTADEAATRTYPHRGSTKGAAIGTAVHRVLELVDLAKPTHDEVLRLAELACAESEIPALVKDVSGRVHTALRTAVVHQAGHSGRTWREVYLIFHDGNRYVEGYIDLLAESSDGKVVVVDYKTDRVDSMEEIAAKSVDYAPQLAQYQEAVRRVVGRRDVTAQLVFASPAPTVGKA